MVSRKVIVKSWKYKFNLFYIYFNKGYSLCSFPKWVAAIFGVGEIVNKNYWVVVAGAFAFFLFCMAIGYIWLEHGFFLAEQEVSNQYNLFQKELRRKLRT